MKANDGTSSGSSPVSCSYNVTMILGMVLGMAPIIRSSHTTFTTQRGHRMPPPRRPFLVFLSESVSLFSVYHCSSRSCSFDISSNLGMKIKKKCYMSGKIKIIKIFIASVRSPLDFFLQQRPLSFQVFQLHDMAAFHIINLFPKRNDFVFQFYVEQL